MDQMNILEDLSEKFEKLKQDINTNNDTIKELYIEKKKYHNEIIRINNSIKELDLKIELYELKKEELDEILNNTQEKFKEIEKFASSLIEIMDTKKK